MNSWDGQRIASKASASIALPHSSLSPKRSLGITNQRETTLCWSRSTGKPLCNAHVWTDARATGVVRAFEKKLDEEGIDIDEDDEDLDAKSGNESIGTGTANSAFAHSGEVVDPAAGVSGTIGKALESLGLAGRGKEGASKKRRKGKEGLLDMSIFNTLEFEVIG